MQRVQVLKSEQIAPNQSLLLDYDQPITTRAEFLKAYRNALGNCDYILYCETNSKGNPKRNSGKPVFRWVHDGTTEYFLTASVTYLSKPHPVFKKRCQLKQWYHSFCEEYSIKPNSKVHIIGIYHYQGLLVFIEFRKEDYLCRKLNSSAAHVYTNDIFQAVVNGVFEKKDMKGNHITAVISRRFKEYITGSLTHKNSLFSFFDNFNHGFLFDKWIRADEAIRQMKSHSWYQYKGAEWAGWFLEFLVSKFLNENPSYSSVIVYIGNRKTFDFLDFDLVFPQSDFYGDLKASDILQTETPGNDRDSVLEALNQNGRLWYVVYEHETIKDTSRKSEMAIERMRLIGKPYVEGGKISYQQRMKHSVCFKRMYIFELNRVNMNQTLSEFNQGHQPDGHSRKPKVSLKKKELNNYIVYSYESGDSELTDQGNYKGRIAAENHD